MNNEQKYNYVKTNDWEQAKKCIKEGYRWTMMATQDNQLIYGLEKEIDDKTPKIELN